jgi:transposase
LTNEEKMMMYKRLALYWCLLEGYSLAKIQQMIGVTHDTTRVYNKRKNTLSEEFKELIGRIGT